MLTLSTSQDDTFQKSADLGALLGQIVVGSMKAFTSANNQLMHGDQFQGKDITAYLTGGAFVNFPGVDKNAVIDVMNNFLVGNAINLLWRTQKIFIMGGGACGDNQGIGQGPQSYSVCRDGKAWYLYYWQENDVISTTSHQWGWVATPPGADKLGRGDWAGIQIAVSLLPLHRSFSVPKPPKGRNQLLPRRLQRRRIQIRRQHRHLPRRSRALRGLAQPRRPRRLLGRHLHHPRLRCRGRSRLELFW